MMSTPEILLERSFTSSDFGTLRARIAALGAAVGLPSPDVDDLVLVCHELVTNAVRHGGGTGRIRAWRRDDLLLCEVSDNGGGIEAAATLGQRPAAARATSGRGLWLVRQISETVEIHSDRQGTRVTAALRLPGTAVRTPAAQASSTDR